MCKDARGAEMQRCGETEGSEARTKSISWSHGIGAWMEVRCVWDGKLSDSGLPLALRHIM